VISADGDDDEAADDQYGSTAGRVHEPSTESGILVAGGFPCIAGESEGGVSEPAIDDGQRGHLRPIHYFGHVALGFRVGGTAERCFGEPPQRHGQ
jgi:hypothetical protein